MSLKLSWDKLCKSAVILAYVHNTDMHNLKCIDKGWSESFWVFITFISNRNYLIVSLLLKMTVYKTDSQNSCKLSHRLSLTGTDWPQSSIVYRSSSLCDDFLTSPSLFLLRSHLAYSFQITRRCMTPMQTSWIFPILKRIKPELFRKSSSGPSKYPSPLKFML